MHQWRRQQQQVVVNRFVDSFGLFFFAGAGGGERGGGIFQGITCRESFFLMLWKMFDIRKQNVNITKGFFFMLKCLEVFLAQLMLS